MEIARILVLACRDGSLVYDLRMSASRQFRQLAIARHRARFVRATRNRWQTRLLFVVGGSAVGAAAAGLAILAERAQGLFLHVLALNRWLGQTRTNRSTCAPAAWR